MGQSGDTDIFIYSTVDVFGMDDILDYTLVSKLEARILKKKKFVHKFEVLSLDE